MKNYIKIAFILTVITGIISCDDKIRELQDLNTAPSLQYFRKSSINWETPGSTPIIDSAKVFNSFNNATYPAIIRILDANLNTSKVTIMSPNADDSFFVNDNVYNGLFEVNTGTEFNIAFRNKARGTFDYSISALDDFDAAQKMTFRITYKENQKPISRLSTAITNTSLRTYSLSAKDSFDRDVAIGGAVVEYEYVIDNIVINSSQPLIYHNFTIGTHQVQLRVKDNDNEWSEYATKTLIVS